ncbi:hypothetical protein [Saccharothrix sp. Mg75]|uniref:hypothetical protein n=1 Tax=Saccharothrix sp. Mg75 TaxID=3445357 RepID=UPI003EE9FDEF
MSFPSSLSPGPVAVLRAAVDDALSALTTAPADGLRLEAVLADFAATVADAAPAAPAPAEPDPTGALAEAHRMLAIGLGRAADGDVAATRRSLVAASAVLSRAGDASAA